MEKLKLFVLSAPLWHILIIGIIYYVAYQSFVLVPPKLNEHRKARYHIVNAGMFCTFGHLLFSFALSAHHSSIPVLLRLSAFLTWTATLAVILSIRR